VKICDPSLNEIKDDLGNYFLLIYSKFTIC